MGKQKWKDNVWKLILVSILSRAIPSSKCTPVVHGSMWDEKSSKGLK